MARLRRRTRRLMVRAALHTSFALPFVLLVLLAPNCRWEDRSSVVVSKSKDTTCGPDYGCIDSYWLEMQNDDWVRVSYEDYRRWQVGDSVSYRWNWCW